ncbi:hypothetical protein LX36DRAFT_497281 [Colletotrichum falcatum]|nr:hypothetical protein LX36DRAFT_497281 [Colletotrichum falcatum]
MPRPRIDLEPFRDDIHEKFQAGWKYSAIISFLSESKSIEVSLATFERYLRKWNFRREIRTEFSTPLLSRIFELFFNQRLTDKYILLTLKNEGFQISPTGLKDIRKCHQLWRRQSKEQLTVAYSKATEYFRTNDDDTHRIRSFGREFLYTYMRQQGHVISRNVLFEAYRTVFPEEVTSRLNEIRYRRKGYTTAGPNYIWSIDAYDKLLPWGFEIYAGIDAYSRYIVWFYVGVEAHTARAVLHQYLHVILQRGIIPCKIRSDRGVETVLAAGGHYFLSQDRTKPNPLAAEQSIPIQFRDCWIFGKSIHNVKIESWWGQLCQASSAQWREYFGRLQAFGLFNPSSLTDRIALLFIFMPLIRKDFTDFVNVWNNHRIRSQKSRPNVVTGQPWQLYYHPDQESAQDCSYPYDPTKLQIMLDILGQDTTLTSLNRYLPDETFQLCEQLLKDIYTISLVLSR